MRLLTRADQGLLDELFQGAHQKEAAMLHEQAQTEDLLRGKTLGELEALETYADESPEAVEWKESKEIMKQALEREQQDDSQKSAWRKLMNLLMQLRKVTTKSGISFFRQLTRAVLQPSIHPASR